MDLGICWMLGKRKRNLIKCQGLRLDERKNLCLELVLEKG